MYLVTNKCHSTIMWPWKANHRGASIIDKFDRPSSFILNPNENDPRGVAWSQFLIRLVPSDKGDLQKKQKGYMYYSQLQHSEPKFKKFTAKLNFKH